MKLYTLTIPENIAPGRLFPWLRRMLPQLPEHAVREALDRRDVKLNGKPPVGSVSTVRPC